MPGMQKHRWLLALSLAWVTAWLWFTWPYWEDDAYIHLEYARSVAEGHGFMFNNRLSNGDTSPLWVILLAMPMALGSPPLLAGKVLAVTCCVATLWMLWCFTLRMQADLGQTAGSTTVWPIAMFASSPYVCYWAFSGMEAVAAAGWLMLQCALLTPRRPRPATLLIASICLGLGPLLRPEMVLMFVAGAPFLWWQVRQVFCDQSMATRVWIGVGCVLALCVPLLLWSSYALHAFGHVLPNTNAAKQAPQGTWVSLRLAQVLALGFPGLCLLTLLSAASWHSTSRQPLMPSAQTRQWLSLPRTAMPLLSWVALVVVFYIVNHTHVQTRYALVLGPGLLATACIVLAQRVQLRGFQLASGTSVLAGCGLSLLLVVPHMRNKIELIDSTARMAAYIEAKVPQREPIAVYAIGQFGFLLRHHELMDLGGITRPGASRFLYDEPGRVAWARHEGARYFIWGEPPEPGAVLVQEFAARSVGWFSSPSAYEQPSPLRLWRLPDEALH